MYALIPLSKHQNSGCYVEFSRYKASIDYGSNEKPSLLLI